MPPTCPIRTAWSASGGLERQGKPQKRQHSSLWSSFRQSPSISFHFERLFRQSDRIRPQIALKISLSHFFDKWKPALCSTVHVRSHSPIFSGWMVARLRSFRWVSFRHFCNRNLRSRLVGRQAFWCGVDGHLIVACLRYLVDNCPLLTKLLIGDFGCNVVSRLSTPC